MSVFEKGKVVEKRTVRLPAGSVADAASDPARSSPRLGVPLWEFTSPHRASTGKTVKLTSQSSRPEPREV